MKLDRYKLLHEDADSFHLDHEEYGKITVPKAHLHHGTVQRIQQHFAAGGEVQAEEDPLAFFKSGDPSDALGMAPLHAPPELSGGDYLAHPGASGPVTLPGTPAAAMATPPPVQQQPSMTGMSPPPGFEQGLANERQGLQGEAAARSQGLQQQAQLSAASAQQQQAIADRSQQLVAERQAGADKLASDVLSQKVNPDHWFESRSTGGKISAVLGMALGGFGAALTHTPNYAMEIVNKAIDRDIEAQKANITQGNNRLSYYMKQTGELMSAQALMKADALSVTAAKMQSAMATAGAAGAGPEAQKLLGALQVQSAQLRQDATMKQMQMEKERLDLNFSRLRMGALGKVMSQYGQPGSANGITISGADEMMMPEEMQKTFVRLPNGKVDFAHTEADAKEVKDTQETSALLRDKLTRYSALLAAHPNGISKYLSSADYAKAQELHNSILTDINGLARLKRFTDNEKDIFLGRLPDITEMQVFGAPSAKLGELGNDIDAATQAANRTRLRFSGGQ